MSSNQAQLVGHNAPDFLFEILGPNGMSSSTTLTQVLSNGRPTVVDFYTSWCKACPVTARKIEAMAVDPRYVGKVNFLLMNLEGDEGSEPARTFCEENGIKVCKQCVLDSENLPDAYGVQGIPHKTLIDEKGIVRQNLDGNGELLSKHLDEVLSAGASGGYPAKVADVASPQKKEVPELPKTADAPKTLMESLAVGEKDEKISRIS